MRHHRTPVASTTSAVMCKRLGNRFSTGTSVYPISSAMNVQLSLMRLELKIA